MGQTLYIGDLHIGHKNILKYRDGFSTTEEHDETLKENLLSESRKRNSIYLLGDCFSTAESFDFASELCNRNLAVHLVMGDNRWRWLVVEQLIREHDNFMVYGLLSKFKWWISHAPIHPDELRGRKANTHGHTHTHCIDDPRYVNLSADQIGFRPVNLEFIRNTLEDGVIKQ